MTTSEQMTHEQFNEAIEPITHICDVCLRQPYENILDGIGADLVAMTQDEDGCWVCAECKAKGIAK